MGRWTALVLNTIIEHKLECEGEEGSWISVWVVASQVE